VRWLFRHDADLPARIPPGRRPASSATSATTARRASTSRICRSIARRPARSGCRPGPPPRTDLFGPLE